MLKPPFLLILSVYYILRGRVGKYDKKIRKEEAVRYLRQYHQASPIQKI